MRKSHLLHITYFLNFFFALHAFAVVYVNSSVLENFFGEKVVGLIYALAALISIGALSAVSKILKNVGDVRFSLFCLAIEVGALLGLAVSSNPLLILGFFILHIICLRLLLVDLDIFLESASSDDTTGTVRGTFLTIGNVALVIAPIFVGFLLGNSEFYGRVYLFAAAILLPAFLLLLISFKNFRDPHYIQHTFSVTLKKVWNNKAIRHIATLDFLLRFFYAWMVIYTPLYLHTYIGLPWSSIGLIFTVMLIPFALLELPLGILADRVYGEKEILISGLALMGATTLTLSFIHSSSIILWMVALFMTRVGASTVEVMSETYFFKHVYEENADIIGFFRSIEPWAYVIAPLAASFFLLVVPIPLLFILLGVIVLSGIPIALELKDTR